MFRNFHNKDILPTHMKSTSPFAINNGLKGSMPVKPSKKQQQIFYSIAGLVISFLLIISGVIHCYKYGYNSHVFCSISKCEFSSNDPLSPFKHISIDRSQLQQIEIVRINEKGDIDSSPKQDVKRGFSLQFYAKNTVVLYSKRDIGRQLSSQSFRQFKLYLDNKTSRFILNSGRNITLNGVLLVIFGMFLLGVISVYGVWMDRKLGNMKKKS